MNSEFGLRGRFRNTLGSILLGTSVALTGLAGAASLPGCGGSGVNVINPPVDEDPGQIPPTPSPVNDLFPDAIPYVRAELAHNGPFGQVIATGGYLDRDYTTAGGQIFYTGSTAHVLLAPYQNNPARVEVDLENLEDHLEGSEYLQESLDNGRPLTIIGTLYETKNLDGSLKRRWVRAHAFKYGIDPASVPEEDLQEFEDTIGDNLEPIGNPYYSAP